MRSLLVVAVVLSALSALPAQGVLPLNGTYRLGALGNTFANPCGTPTSIPSVSASDGTLTLVPSGTGTVSVTENEVCPGGQVFPDRLDVTSVPYQVGTDGTITFGDDPATPGTDALTCFMRADGAVMVGTRSNEGSEDAEVLILVALSSGHGQASLNGPYHVARMVQRNDATALTLRSELGVITFNGSGGYSESGTRHAVVYGGTASAPAPYSGNGSYAVAPDGTLAAAPATIGAVSADRQVFFWVRRAGVEVELTVGVRRGAAYGPALIDGAWGIGAIETSIGASALPGGPVLQTDYGTLDFAPPGVLSGTLFHCDTTPFATSCDAASVTGSFALAAATGTLSLVPVGSAAIPGALSADGTVLVATPRPGNGVGLTLGISRCAWPAPIGTATAGSGGWPPVLASFGGFPWAGNAGFGLLAYGGGGGAPAALLLAQGASGGIPLLGGIVWIDVTRFVSSIPLALSGPAGIAGVGAAGVRFALPASTALAGARLVGQTFVLDPGAPQGLAMSAGLDVVVCR